MLYVLDVFFFVFHSGLVLFNLFGWIWKRTRKWNLATILLTAGSWFVLGIWYGWGYCPCTDWHWQVREALGHTHLPGSYMKFLADTLTGMNWDAKLVDTLTIVGLFAALAGSLALNTRDYLKGRQKHSTK